MTNSANSTCHICVFTAEDVFTYFHSENHQSMLFERGCSNFCIHLYRPATLTFSGRPKSLSKSVVHTPAGSTIPRHVTQHPSYYVFQRLACAWQVSTGATHVEPKDTGHCPPEEYDTAKCR